MLACRQRSWNPLACPLSQHPQRRLHAAAASRRGSPQAVQWPQLFDELQWLVAQHFQLLLFLAPTAQPEAGIGCVACQISGGGVGRVVKGCAGQSCGVPQTGSGGQLPLPVQWLTLLAVHIVQAQECSLLVLHLQKRRRQLLLIGGGQPRARRRPGRRQLQPGNGTRSAGSAQELRAASLPCVEPAHVSAGGRQPALPYACPRAPNACSLGRCFTLSSSSPSGLTSS